MKQKNLKFAAYLIAAVMFAFTSCNKDDDDDNTPVTPAPTPEYEELVGDISANLTLDKTKKYLLNGFVFVNEGVTLTIPEGTLIEGAPGQGENASALIIQKGAKIIANGTAAEPIIFTAQNDGREGTYNKNIQGLWGGIIILGKATTNNTTSKRIEGIPEQYDAFYGMDGNAGADDADNSGSLSYVSIRHGGTDIGAGNEINGLSLGAVGYGTNFDHIEVVANADDGVEFFGGAPQLSHVIVSLCGDDSFDYDEGFHGKGQFWVAIQSEGTGDRCAEQDGGTGSDETAAPYAEPMIYNASYIANEDGAFMIFRDNAAGVYGNSIFAKGAEGIRVEFRADKHSSYDWLTDADPEASLMINNSVFSAMAGTVFAKAEDGTLPEDHEAIMTAWYTDNANGEEDMGIDGDNPVPATASAVAVAPKPADAFFVDAAYQGAFAPGGSNWASGWTLLFNNK